MDIVFYILDSTTSAKSEPFNPKAMSNKTRYWRISSNGELSATVKILEDANTLIEEDFQEYDEDDQKNIWYKLKPVWLTDEEYEALPEL